MSYCLYEFAYGDPNIWFYNANNISQMFPIFKKRTDSYLRPKVYIGKLCIFLQIDMGLVMDSMGFCLIAEK